MTKEELINLLSHSELPESVMTDQYLDEMLKMSDDEIYDEISRINGFWDAAFTQQHHKTR